MIDIAGMAHVQLTVNDLERAVEFYEKVLGYLGMRPAMRFPGGLYMVGGKTAVMITQSSTDNREVQFDQRRIGLHHLCFRARSREDIDEFHRFLVREAVRIVHAPEDGPWAPGYYSVLFEDPTKLPLAEFAGHQQKSERG